MSYTDEKFEGTKAQKLFGSVAVVDILKRNIETGNKDAIIASLRKTAGYTNKEQFEFTRPQAEAIFGFRTIGTLMMGEQHMRAVWANYAKILQEVINPIYSNLQEFTNNINAYLLGAEDNGLTKAAIEKCHALVKFKSEMSLNVAVAGSIVLYDRGINKPRS